MMSDALTMTGWHTAVTNSLRDIAWVKFVGNYETICTQASGPEPRIEDKDWQTPALLVSVPGWDMAEGGGEGRLTVELSIELYVVFDRIPTEGKMTEAELFVRSAAADISQWGHGNVFGLPSVDPAVFVRAERDVFSPELDDYLVFRVELTQKARLGPDPFARGEGMPLQSVWLGKAPDIGYAHVNDYRLIYQAGEWQSE
ncbi:hypothetical protein [Klebsiella quasipneumoniae]|uniref:hypothetical protein n=1 Tax=Klebsiella quasipneumoniae TaxID=1463165 RepID=UPI00352B7872